MRTAIPLQPDRHRLHFHALLDAQPAVLGTEAPLLEPAEGGLRPGGPRLGAAGRGYPAVGTEGFPGNLAVNKQLKTLMDEGATIHACRFAMGALYGMREDDLIPGIQAFSPLDVLDAALTAWKEGQFQLNTWTV